MEEFIVGFSYQEKRRNGRYRNCIMHFNLRAFNTEDALNEFCENQGIDRGRIVKKQILANETIEEGRVLAECLDKLNAFFIIVQPKSIYLNFDVFNGYIINEIPKYFIENNIKIKSSVLRDFEAEVRAGIYLE